MTRLPSATAEITTPASAASRRVRGWVRPAIVTSTAAALARNSGPIHRTSWNSPTNCWTCTTPSPARRSAPSAYAAGAAASFATALDRSPGSGVLVAIAAARARRCRGDRGPSRRQHVPGSAESGVALAGGVAGLLVALEAVEGLAVVAALPLSVGPRDGAEQRGLRAVPGRRRAARAQRGPCHGASAGARALVAGVLHPQVEGAVI